MPPLRTLTLGLAIAAGALHAQAATITVDTVIDGPLTMDQTILDGPDGPTTVTVTEGGALRSFRARENSHLIIDGGEITFPSLLEDNATLTLLSGSIDCTDRLCPAVSFPGIVSARDQSRINIHSGQLQFPLFLFDTSTAAFFGRNLTTLNVFEFTVVMGESLSGEEIFVPVIVNDPSRITLNEIPEPSSLGCLLLLGGASQFKPTRRPTPSAPQSFHFA